MMRVLIYFEGRTGKCSDRLDVGVRNRKESRLVPRYFSLSNQKIGILLLK